MADNGCLCFVLSAQWKVLCYDPREDFEALLSLFCGPKWEHFIETPERFSLPSENPGVEDTASSYVGGSAIYNCSTSLLVAGKVARRISLIHSNLFLFFQRVCKAARFPAGGAMLYHTLPGLGHLAQNFHIVQKFFGLGFKIKLKLKGAIKDKFQV